VSDVTDPDDAAALAERAAEALGGLDAVVYSAGTALLGSIATTSAAHWQEMLWTNLVGASLVVSGALDVLRSAADATPPTVVLLSTHITERPWPGLVPYAASKAGMDVWARGLREEEPWLRVVDIVVGNTTTGFADAWDPEATASAFERWMAGGYFDGVVHTADEMAAVVLESIADPTGPEEINVVTSARRSG